MQTFEGPLQHFQYVAPPRLLTGVPLEGVRQAGFERHGWSAARSSRVPLLTDVLNGVERLAAADKRKALVVLDEFQQVLSEAGEKAERQIRAAVQTHHNVGYVFAGSSTRMMMEMIFSSARAFWQLGDQLHLGPIPREDFVPFLRKGLQSTGATVAEEALLHILDLSEDVPFDVQQLASQCWMLLRGGRRHLTARVVDEALGQVVSMQHASYLQRWLSLSMPQKRTLRIVVEERGDFQLTEVARRHGLPRTTMHYHAARLTSAGGASFPAPGFCPHRGCLAPRRSIPASLADRAAGAVMVARVVRP